MSKMEKLEYFVNCNPSIKLKKGEYYPLVDIDSIVIGKKHPVDKGLVCFTGQSCSKFQNGDTIMARITPCLENGKIAMIETDKEACIGSTELFVFREKKDVSTNQFVYYFLRQKWIRDLSANSMTGASGRQRADLKFIKKIKVNFPVLDAQKRIADVLSAYDRLIENNNKRIKLLEQMAENLYKEWFVRFRFPGYEKAEFENGIPKEWEINRLSHFGRIETGKTPSMGNNEYYGGDILFVKTPDMHDNTFVIDSEQKLSIMGSNSQSKKFLPKHSIMVTCIGTGGIVAINAEPAHTNQQINSIVLDDEMLLEWLFCTCKSLKETIEMFGSTGTTMTNLSKGKFEKLKVLYPGKDLVYKFHTVIGKAFCEIKNLLYQNQLLIKQRDMLLPRLMSGKLEV